MPTALAQTADPMQSTEPVPTDAVSIEAVLADAVQDAKPRRTPERPWALPWGNQRWEDLVFIHWRVEAGALENLLPPELTADTWDGDAWVGLVPFRICNIRPRVWPPAAWCPSFWEVNVRTYVRPRGGPAGVWFFSMDAESAMAVLMARWRWNFNYRKARIRRVAADDQLCLESRRAGLGRAGAGLKLRARFGEPLERSRTPIVNGAGNSAASTLDDFLTERYLYYSMTRGGRLMVGKVEHEAYQLQKAEVLELDESLLAAAGIVVHTPPEHVCFCRGVNSTVWGPQRVGSRE